MKYSYTSYSVAKKFCGTSQITKDPDFPCALPFQYFFSLSHFSKSASGLRFFALSKTPYLLQIALATVTILGGI